MPEPGKKCTNDDSVRPWFPTGFISDEAIAPRGAYSSDVDFPVQHTATGIHSAATGQLLC